MEAWNQAWKSDEGRQGWLTADPFVVARIPQLQEANVRRVLDLGFGVGRHTVLLAQAGFEVYGIDASVNGQTYAHAWAERTGVTVHLQTGDMTTLPYADHFFDAILTWNVIYHGTAEVVNETIREIERVLKEDGYLLCTLLSTKHRRYGRGVEIEPNVFIIPGEGEASHPHHYFDEATARSYLENFEIFLCEDVEQNGANTYHWQIFGRHRP
jgi:tellurite methyltransferase